MGNFETMMVAMAALAVSGLCVVAFVGWWLNGTVQTATDELRESADELRARMERQSEQLATMSTELHQARVAPRDARSGARPCARSEHGAWGARARAGAERRARPDGGQP